MWNLNEVSKHVQFYRRNQRIPHIEQVREAYWQAKQGEIKGAIELLNWKRHCFYVRTPAEIETMELVFAFCRELFDSESLSTES
ncbi:hypothetical protein FHS15_003625 [Paenibacillus castaneae]|uniref:hypothetical protein n=1 Tax=Paenibacillus castaneae TaxID=474957 RepID=UPI000C999A1C|nr:hypothetical protein [Paenibacillus castaneae]NIK78487.1 hypothetical protein [Paenibacillus castaneae]